MTKSYSTSAGAIKAARRITFPAGVSVDSITPESHPDEGDRFMPIINVSGTAAALATIPAQLDEDHVLRLEPVEVAIAEPRVALETFRQKGVLTHRLQVRVTDPVTGKRSPRHVASVRDGRQPNVEKIVARAAELGVPEAVARDAHRRFVSYIGERAAG